MTKLPFQNRCYEHKFSPWKLNATTGLYRRACLKFGCGLIEKKATETGEVTKTYCYL